MKKIIITEQQLKKIISENIKSNAVDEVLDKINEKGIDKISKFEKLILKNDLSQYETIYDAIIDKLISIFRNLTEQKSTGRSWGEEIKLTYYYEDVEKNPFFVYNETKNELSINNNELSKLEKYFKQVDLFEHIMQAFILLHDIKPKKIDIVYYNEP